MLDKRLLFPAIAFLTLGLNTGCARPAAHPAPPPPTPRAKPAAQPLALAATAPAPVPPAVEPTPDPDPVVPCPPEMALVGERVCVDRWEASLVLIAADGSEQPWSPYQPPHGDLRAVSRPGVVPQAYVNGQQASDACQRAGKRLCSADEWILACRGPEDTLFPYGPTRQDGICNDDGRVVHPVVEAARRAGSPPERMWYEGMLDPHINQLEDTVDKTGTHPECTNGYGTFDMVGNLHEWIDDPEGTFRGGFFMDTRQNGDGCDYTTRAHPFSYYDYSTGFRCCRDVDPEPGA